MTARRSDRAGGPEDPSPAVSAKGAPSRVVLYRVQDREGRGPYRPGLSVQWADYEAGDHYCPPFFVEMGIGAAEVPRLFTPGWHGGCAFRNVDDVFRWFAPKERVALDRLGYRINAIVPDRIIAETPTQIVFECRRPLREWWHNTTDERLRDRDAAPRKAAGFEAEGQQPGPSGIAERINP